MLPGTLIGLKYRGDVLLITSYLISNLTTWMIKLDPTVLKSCKNVLQNEAVDDLPWRALLVFDTMINSDVHGNYMFET